MRIAYITGRYPAVSHTFVTREVHALRELGVEVDTASVWATDAGQLLTDVDRREHEQTYALLPLRPGRAALAHARAALRRPRRYAATARAALRLARPGLRGRALAVLWFAEAIVLWDWTRRRGVRHLHAHLNGTAPSLALLVATFDERRTWSLTVHGPAEFADVPGERLPEKVRRATFVVCISDFARSQLMALVDEEHWPKLHIVHCGVEPDVFRPSGEPPAGDGVLRVLNVARLARTKGHGVLLEAVALLRRRGVAVELQVVGDGPKRADLERHAERLGVADAVVFAGAVGQDRIRRHFAEADVFCSASFAEGVPVVLMEAMAMQLPVVAPAIMGIAELVEDGVSGVLVPPARPDRIADALEALATGRLDGAALGRHGRAKVVEDFDVRRSAARLRELFAAVDGR